MITPGSSMDKKSFIKNLRGFLSMLIIQANPRFTTGEEEEKEKVQIENIY